MGRHLSVNYKWHILVSVSIPLSAKEGKEGLSFLLSHNLGLF